MSILISPDPGEEIRQKAAFMVESAMADPRQFVADAADSLVGLLYKLMGVQSCVRHVLREDGSIKDANNRNSNDTLHNDDDDTKENDDQEMMDYEGGELSSSSPSWPFIISANPSSNNKNMTNEKRPETISSRKRKPLSPKHNSPSSVLSPLSSPPASLCASAPGLATAFAPSSAAALIRPSKRPRKVSLHGAGEREIDLSHGFSILLFLI